MLVQDCIGNRIKSLPSYICDGQTYLSYIGQIRIKSLPSDINLVDDSLNKIKCILELQGQMLETKGFKLIGLRLNI